MGKLRGKVENGLLDQAVLESWGDDGDELPGAFKNVDVQVTEGANGDPHCTTGSCNALAEVGNDLAIGYDHPYPVQGINLSEGEDALDAGFCFSGGGR